jgi:DNA end-binding protein Ku
MNARAIWTGELTVDGMHLPVKLYSAVLDRDVHFHLLHKSDNTRLQQRMVNPETEQAVPREHTRKAYPLGDSEYILLDESELDRLEPPRSPKIEITRFVPSESVALEWFDRPYYLGPTAESSDDYYAFAAALAADEQCGIARWVMRKKEYVGALCAEDSHLLLITMHKAPEIVPSSDLEPPRGRDLSHEERDLAEQLVDSLTGKFQPSAYRDTYQDRVRELVKAKQKGKTLRKPRAPARRPPSKSLADSLRKSLTAVRHRA